MSCICPADLKPCPDDVCIGSGYCMRRAGESVLERCVQCRQIFDPTGCSTLCDDCCDDYREDEDWDDED